MDGRFAKAVSVVLRHEGGYVNDPADPGGETKYGISKRSYPDIDIKALAYADAIEIYYRDWWFKYGYGRIKDYDVALKVFDLSVNMGPRTAHKLLQQAITSSGGEALTIDGMIGPQTLAAVNSHPAPAFLLAAYKLNAIQYYVNRQKPRFLAGWIRRALS